MIQKIDAPANTAAFRAVGEVTAEDYKNVLVPEVTKLAKDSNEINFLFLIDTEMKYFTTATWIEDAILGLKSLGKWNRAAIVTDSDKAISLTKAFGYFAAGEFKGFKKEAFHQALKWVETGTK